MVVQLYKLTKNQWTVHLTVGELYGCKLYLNQAVKTEKNKIRFQDGFVVPFKKSIEPFCFNSSYFKISVF